jgi:AraC-like DNA-binding protein
MRHFMDVVYRPALSSPGVPLGLRSVGHARLKPGYRDRDRVIDFAHLIWTVGGTGFVRMNDTDYPQNPGHLAVYMPGNRHNFFTVDSEWECRWLTLDGPAVVLVLNGFGIGPQPVLTGECPVQGLTTLRRHIKEIGPTRERKTSSAVYALLAEISPIPDTEPRESGEMIARAEAYIAEHLADTLMGVDQVARLLGVNRSVFSTTFKGAIGLSPKDYIQSSRLQVALSLLKATALPIAEVSALAGFSDPNYFAKFFAKRMGMSPSDFRGST